MKEPVGFTLEVMLILYNVGYKLNKNNIYKFKQKAKESLEAETEDDL